MEEKQLAERLVALYKELGGRIRRKRQGIDNMEQERRKALEGVDGGENYTICIPNATSLLNEIERLKAKRDVLVELAEESDLLADLMHADFELDVEEGK